MQKVTTRRQLLSELEGSWVFERSGDGTIFFYPHGWGRAYVVPTEEKQREIEEFLGLWVARLRSGIRLARWLLLPALAILLAVFVLAGFVPAFRRMVWNLPGWPAVFVSTFFLGALACLLVLGSQLALRFLAETAKADLEKAQSWRPFAESLRAYARQCSWSRLWIEEACCGFVLVEGLRFLWPRRETILLPARVNHHLLPVGVALIALGGVMGLVKLWEIRAKFQG